MRRIPPELAARLHRRARAERWDVAPDEFAAALQTAADRAFADRAPSSRELEAHLGTLHLDDLALAVACATGHEEAWEHFIATVRPGLYRAADALDPTGGAREAADALYADLYGTRERDGRRASLLRHYHGRSALATWLRAVLAQRHVDRLRASRRLEPLSDETVSSTLQTETPPENPDRRRHYALLQRALTAAVAALAPRDRLRLACYYARQLTLAETGRVLGEHEATVSRQLARTRRSVRASVERTLSSAGLADGQIADCIEGAVADPGPLDLERIVGKDSVPDRSI